MNMDIVQISLELIIVGLSLYLIFFKSYFKEKGKNVATKEDIEEITELVEKVKKRLYFTTESKLSFKMQERDALVNCYEKYSYWLNYVSYVSLPTTFNEDNKEKYREIENRMADAKLNCDQSAGRMALFINNDELNDVAAEMKLKTLEMQHLVIKVMSKMEHSDWKRTSVIEDATLPQRDEKHKKLLDERGEIFDQHREEKIAKHQEVALLNRKFQNIAYSHLQKLLEH